MTPSLFVCARLAEMESRTTKSDILMMDASGTVLSEEWRVKSKKKPTPSGLFHSSLSTLHSPLLVVRFPAHRRRVAVVLNLVFVLADLMVELIENQIDGRQQVLVSLGGDEVVLMFRGNLQFHDFVVVLDIDNRLDHHQAGKVVDEPADF